MLTGEGKLDFLGFLAAITPAGATSFLVRVEGETDATVVAAHGPLAASVWRPPARAAGAPTDAQRPGHVVPGSQSRRDPAAPVNTWPASTPR